MTAFPKVTRTQNRSLLEAVRNLPCLGCASIDPSGARAALFEDGIRSHPHHVITRGHGGGDVAENVMPVCVKHHQEAHKGLTAFSERYQVAKDWLQGAGWTFNGVTWEEPACVYGRADGQD